MGISEEDLRLLRRMEDLLSGFLDGTVTIDSVVSDLESLLEAMDETPDAWRRSLREEYETLEVTSSVALSQNAQALRGTPAPPAPELRETAERMLELVEDQTLQYPDLNLSGSPDSTIL